MKKFRMPKTRKEFETDMILAFQAGMTAGYGIEHTNINEEENAAVIDFANRNGFKTYLIERSNHEQSV